jgi:hypothetical protein
VPVTPICKTNRVQASTLEFEVSSPPHQNTPAQEQSA